MSRRPLRWPISSAGRTAFIERIASDPLAAVKSAVGHCAGVAPPALGGHIDQCTSCGHRATISYNTCIMGSFF